MSNWKIVNESPEFDPLSILVVPFVGGEPLSTFTIKNTDTGEQKEVMAFGTEDLGRQIAEGNFEPSSDTSSS